MDSQKTYHYRQNLSKRMCNFSAALLANVKQELVGDLD
jgi:hypothetical protein